LEGRGEVEVEVEVEAERVGVVWVGEERVSVQHYLVGV
jgi:hypothetical protein